MPRLYWVMAISLLARYWEPAMLTALQLASLALIAATIVVTAQRALRQGRLVRVLLESLRC